MRRFVSFASMLVTLIVLVVVLTTATLVDRRPPRVERVSLSATAGAADRAQVLSTIDVEFDEPVDHASVEHRFRIEPFVAGSIIWKGSTAIFIPASRLTPDARFTVWIDAGFTDLAGNAAPIGLESWSFTTGRGSASTAGTGARR